MTLAEFIALVARMRAAQARLGGGRNPDALADARRLEQLCDRALEAFRSEERGAGLFGEGPG